jgi:chromate reductase, NAD(P)H dehydrogenase (quinone)
MWSLVPSIDVVALSGSLRQRSANTALLRAARELADDDVEVTIVPLDDVPMYNGDLERDGPPTAVAGLRARVGQADGLLLASPEYNHSTSAVLKNAIDWLSRGPDAPIDRLPTALMSAAGGSGGVGAQRHLREILAHNDVDVLDRRVQVVRAWRHLDHAGRLAGAGPRAEVAELVAALADRIRDTHDDVAV